MLANDSKNWVVADIRSGYQMLWVGQEALFVYKVREILPIWLDLTYTPCLNCISLALAGFYSTLQFISSIYFIVR